jgi:Protein of unknown function (DUF4058)
MMQGKFVPILNSSNSLADLGESRYPTRSVAARFPQEKRPIMKSPFPGMDPFIECCGLWEDFHGHLVEKICESLADTVPANYLVRTGERGYVVLADDESRKSHSFKPDVSVTTNRGGAPETGDATALMDPPTESGALSLRAFVEEEFRETFVEIHEAEGERRLVTGIEVLSPSNKKMNSPGWDLYLRKRQGFFLSRAAHLMEIDLLRGGQRMPMVDPWPGSAYTLMVARKHNMPYCKVWPAHFQHPLPPIPVPLFKPDPDVMLDLQPMIDGIYARWRFHASIDYTRRLTPPLTPDETTWLAEQIRKLA